MHHHHQIRPLHLPNRALSHLPLNQPQSLPPPLPLALVPRPLSLPVHPCHIHHPHISPRHAHPRRQRIPSRPRHPRNHRPILTSQRIEQRALPRIRPPHQHHPGLVRKPLE